jgi:adenylosuccinate lyase
LPASSEVHLVVLRDGARRGRLRNVPPADAAEIRDAEELASFTFEALKAIGRKAGVDVKGLSTREEVTQRLRDALFPAGADGHGG